MQRNVQICGVHGGSHNSLCARCCNTVCSARARTGDAKDVRLPQASMPYFHAIRLGFPLVGSSDLLMAQISLNIWHCQAKCILCKFLHSICRPVYLNSIRVLEYLENTKKKSLDSWKNWAICDFYISIFLYFCGLKTGFVDQVRPHLDWAQLEE